MLGYCGLTLKATLTVAKVLLRESQRIGPKRASVNPEHQGHHKHKFPAAEIGNVPRQQPRNHICETNSRTSS